MPGTPVENPAPAPERSTPSPQRRAEPSPMREATPGTNSWQRARDKFQQTASSIKNTAEKTSTGIRKVLNFDDPGDENPLTLKQSPKLLYKAPLNLVDGTVGNASRRLWEMTEDYGGQIKSIFGLMSPMLRPINSLKHPFETGKKIGTNLMRTGTVTGKLLADTVNAPFRFLDELVNRGGKRNFQLMENFPLLGKPLSWLGKKAGWLASLPKRATEWLTKPVYTADEWAKGIQS